MLSRARDTDFGSQTGYNELVHTFENQIRWIPINAAQHPEEFFDFRRPFAFWWNGRKMDRYIGNELDERFQSRKEGRSKTKYVIDLAMEVYAKEKGESLDQMKNLDPAFRSAAIDQVKVFIFAGHDTSTSAISYCFYHLSRNPSALAAVRKELDDVFGTDTSQTAEKIKNDPYSINKLDYTIAVIREVLRMHPPASAMRYGSKE